MNIVVAAYEFPPSRSPQAMRWGELARELALLGHRVTVLTASRAATDVAEIVAAAAWPGAEGVSTVRTPPSHVHGLLAVIGWLVRGRGAARKPLAIPRSFDGLNWRGIVVAAVGRALEWASFPDIRAQWNSTAGPALERMIRAVRPDIVITSHEPASVLLLGRTALRAGVPWAADLGDPVVADYLPVRWRRRAQRLEREVCAKCSMVSVTTEGYARKLRADHRLDEARCLVLRQGFSPPPAQAAGDVDFHPNNLELLYTGQLYGFRSADALVSALEELEGIRLTVFSPNLERLRAVADRLHGRLRLMAPVAPEVVGRWQRSADVLVNIGNTMPLQVPGKIFEYFGSGRPILHLSACDPDEAAGLVRDRRRGWVTNNEAGAIRAELAVLKSRWRDGILEEGLDLSSASVADFSWSAQAARLSSALIEAVERNKKRQHQA